MNEISEKPSIKLALKNPTYVSFYGSDGIKLVENIVICEIPPYKIDEEKGEVLCGFDFSYFYNFRVYLPIKETEQEFLEKIKIFKDSQKQKEE